MTPIKTPSDVNTSDNIPTNKNSNDSLQNYFDDLLLGPEFESKSLSQASITTSLRLENGAASAKAIDPITKILAKPIIALPRFADPMLQQKINLQKLLHSVPPATQTLEAEVKLAPSEKIALATAMMESSEIQEWELEISKPVTLDTVVPETVVDSTHESIKQTYHVPGVEWLPNGLPQWAQAKFDVLLVKVSGLTLAVPLISLGQIQPITDELTHLFGQADWFIGIQPTHTGKIRVVNTAKFVMPERYDENFVKNAKLLVSINGVPWGLAVDSVNQPISLEPGEIKWRTDRSKRPWLAGIIKEQMCALLDIPMIGQLLMDSDKNSSKNRP